MKRRLWRLADRALSRVGLERISQNPIKELEIAMPDHGPRYIKIEFRDGHRVSGYLDSRFSGILKYGDNPLITR